jgi:hypothetical protein
VLAVVWVAGRLVAEMLGFFGGAAFFLTTLGLAGVLARAGWCATADLLGDAGAGFAGAVALCLVGAGTSCASVTIDGW